LTGKTGDADGFVYHDFPGPGVIRREDDDLADRA